MDSVEQDKLTPLLLCANRTARPLAKSRALSIFRGKGGRLTALTLVFNRCRKTWLPLWVLTPHCAG
jgi:hypothetical protein